MDYKYLLISSVFAPLLAMLIVLFTPHMPKKFVKTVAIITSSYSAVAALFLCAGIFISGTGADFNYVLVGYGNILPNFGLNGISAVMFLLASLVSLSAVWVGKTAFIKNYKTYLLLLLFSQLGLLAMFATTNMLWAYLFHEFALVPTFIATLYWGGFGRRSASMQMAIYLTVGALISLVGIVGLYLYSAAPSFEVTDLISASLAKIESGHTANVIFFLMAIGFAILMSIFPFHSWAFKGYTAAPTAFSMIHAGVLKKFGFFMLLQLAIPALPISAGELMPYFAILALFNIVLVGIYTIAQRDLKMMFSYSSVSHIGICVLGVATMSVLGAGSAVVYAFAHGLSIAVLFYLSNLVANKAETYDMREMGGLISRLPILCAFFVMAVFASIALPAFANFWGEVGVFVAAFGYNITFAVLACLGLIISAIYGLRAVANVFYGGSKAKFDNLKDINFKEKIPAIILLIFLIIVGFYPRSITKMIDENLSANAIYSQNK